METLSLYEIDLKAMLPGAEERRWHLDDAFFAALEGAQIEHGDLDVALRVKKASGTYELTFSVEGQVSVPCDRCLEPMQQPVQTEETLRVRLGETFNDDGDIITVPEETGTLNCAWNIYEIIALALPLHHVHPQGQCSSDMEDLLRSHSAEGSTDPDGAHGETPLRKILEQYIKEKENGTS